MKYIVIGGVAGGATAAARIRRNTEQAEIILVYAQIVGSILEFRQEGE